MKRVERLILFFFIGLLAPHVRECSGIEATWTPNDQDDGGGPLPLSQAQRDQLLQLEQAIVNSPNPQETLLKVAESNNMDPQELVNMLERNRQDMGGGAGVQRRRVVNAWPQAILRTVSSLGLILAQTAQRSPRTFALASLSIMLMIHVFISTPRTGLVLSKGSGILSRGHSTMFNPPTRYVNKVLESNKFAQYDLSLPKNVKRVAFDELPDGLAKDGVQVHKLLRKSTLAQAVTAQRTLDADDFMPPNDDEADQQETEEKQTVVDTMYDSAAEVLSSRRLTEFVEPTNLLRFQSSQERRQRSAILVVNNMGNWGRYGLQPLRVSQQQEGESNSSLVFTTLKGGHFDGQLSINVERTKKDTLSIHVRLGVPKKGRKLNKKLASVIVDTVAQSITRSITTQTRQTLARKSQGRRYHDNFETRTKERRKIRFDNERKQEEMAKDRRRKWQRQNPDAGRYRPSGDRMRSPNSC